MDLTRQADEYWDAKDDSVDEERLQLYLDRVRAGEEVLVVDGGPGMLALLLGEHGCRVRITDVSAHAVERARRKGLDAVQVDTAEAPLPYEGASFAVVISDSAIEHRFDPRRALSECARLLRPGGRLLLLVPNIAHWRHRLWLLRGRFPEIQDGPTDRCHLRFFTAAEARSILRELGLVPVETSGFASLWVKGLYPRLLRAPLVRSLYGLLVRLRPSLFARDVLIVARRP